MRPLYASEKRRALVTGVSGQDGAYLSRFLLAKGYEVTGTHRPGQAVSPARLTRLGIDEDVTCLPLELSDEDNITAVIQQVHPHEIYNLAAQSNVARAFREPLETGDVTGLGAMRVLEAVRLFDPRIRFFQASSSEMFGHAAGLLNEKSVFQPRSPYAIAKLYAHWATVNYREAFGLFAVSGISFNHESPLRPREFVTRKISQAVAEIKLERKSELVLGNISARRDWGYAPEYVEGWWSALQRDEPSDYVFATGRDHSVADFASAAFRVLDLDWTDYVRTDDSLLRPVDVERTVGDASHAAELLGWHPRTSFEELVGIMVRADLEELQSSDSIWGAKRSKRDGDVVTSSEIGRTSSEESER